MAKVKIKRSEKADVLTIYEAFEGFIQQKQADNKSATTIDNYTRTFKAFCDYFEFNSDTLIDEVSSDTIFQWKAHMHNDGLRPCSINHYVRDIRAFLYWCMDEDREYLSPFKIKPVEETNEIPKHYDDDEVLLQLQKPTRRDGYTVWRNWAVFNWIMATGTRASTLCEVKLKDINFTKKEITLRHMKGKQQLIIPLSSSLEAVVREFIRIWRSGDEVTMESYLFANIGEGKLTRNALYLSYRNYCKSNGLDTTSIHAIRHTYAKQFVKNHGDVFTLQKILGHKKLDMTKKYVELFADDIKEGYDAVSPLDTIKRSQKRTQAVKRNDE